MTATIPRIAVPQVPVLGSIDLVSLCREHGSSVLRRCRAILRDPAAAEDAAQEVFMLVMAKGHQVRDEASVPAWLYRLTTHHCLNRLRSESRRSSREQSDGVAAWQVASPVDPYERYKAKDALFKLTGELDPLAQQIFVYKYLDGLTQEEIAQLTGKSRRTIGKRLKALEASLAKHVEASL